MKPYEVKQGYFYTIERKESEVNRSNDDFTKANTACKKISDWKITTHSF